MRRSRRIFPRSNWRHLRPVQRAIETFTTRLGYWLFLRGKRRHFASLCFAFFASRKRVRSEPDRLRERAGSERNVNRLPSNYLIDPRADQ